MTRAAALPGVPGKYLRRLRLQVAWRRHGRARVSVASAVLVFAFSGLTALAAVAAGVVYLARDTATNEAIRDARVVTEVVGRSVIEPVVSDSILDGDAAALSRLDRVVREQVIDGSIVRVKLWTRDGRIVYSDETRVIGQQFQLPGEEIEAFQSNAANAEVSDLSRPENEYERQWRKLLEVYLPIHTPSGIPLLFESYLPYKSISSSGNQIWKRFLPVVVVGLVLLELVQLPLAWSLARSLRRGQDERESLLRRAMEASDRERRIIAGELHDGAVQDLVGHSYRLAAAADRVAGIAPDEVVRDLRQASAQSRRTVQELRSLVVDLYPPNLRTEGLEAAVADLAAPLRARGTTVAIAIPSEIRLPGDTERLLYRAAREALRNVLQHTNAGSVQVTLSEEARTWTLMVVDDGGEYSASRHVERRAKGHLGLDLLEALVRDSGGTFSIALDGGGRTSVTVQVPRP